MEPKVKSKFAKGSDRYQDALTGDVDRKIANDPKNIPGWGIDANPDNDPTYPMKNRNGDDYQRIHYQKVVQQPLIDGVFQSIERPEMTRVFGTSTPATGLSGKIREYAYKFSEADARHWMTLLMADRVNAIEGIVDDLKHGIVPNFFEERGWTAEFRYNRPAAMRKVAIAGAAIGVAAIAIILLQKGKNKTSSPDTMATI